MAFRNVIVCLAVGLCALLLVHANPSSQRIGGGTDAEFMVGSGIADVTGEIAEVGFMGYAVVGQRGSGIHIRSRARAFIVVDNKTGTRVVYVSFDLCMGFQMMKTAVIEKLEASFGNLYTDQNVILSGTHTHSTPGGIGGTVLVDVTTFGFVKENFDSAVQGTYEAISRAHYNLRPGVMKINRGQLVEASINRSPASYLLDPEKDDYPYNVDKDMTVIRFEGLDGTELGMIDFYAVHAVSMNNSNTLVSADNKGLASLLMEKAKNPAGTLPGKGQFVAAFGNSNEGDVSPNTAGPRCITDGSPCDFVHSTCGGKTESCIAFGPGKDMWESTEIIANMQFQAGYKLYENATTVLTGGVDFRHTYVDMQSVSVSAEFTSTGQNATTCTAGMGYSFAGGTTDGPGDFDFTQGTTSPNPFWAFVSGFLAKPTAEQIACQAPKPILLDVGLTKPLEWVPFILPLQVVRIGQLFIVAVPGEFTTMSGRRLRNTIQKTLQQQGAWRDDSIIVISGLSNSYSHYIATYEEYQLQRYEGASTLYGPHTLAAYQQEFSKLIVAMAAGAPVPAGPQPMDMRNHTFSFLPGVVVDGTPIGKNFGDIQTDVQPSYTINETVSATFWCASPRNDLLREQTFLTIEKLNNGGSFDVIADDGNWETKFHWKRVSIDQSQCTVEWLIPADTPRGSYRIRTFGVSKSLFGTKTPFSGSSGLFNVV